MTDRLFQILNNSTLLNHYQTQVHQKVGLRDSSLEYRQEWSDACDQFHNSFNTLFFPGGRETLMKLRQHDPAAIDAAIDFLMADPVHFRSGYLKEKLWHKAPQWNLSSVDQARIEQAALAYLYKQIRRDFWYMCRAMARMGSASFWQIVSQHIDHQHRVIAKRAAYLWAYQAGTEAGELIRKAVHDQALYSKWSRIQ